MARNPKFTALPRSFRRTRAFIVTNLVLWGVIGGWYLFQPVTRQQEVSRLVGNLLDGRKQVTAFDVGWDLWQLYFSDEFVRAAPTGDRTHLLGGAPRLSAGSGAGPVRVLSNSSYVVGYSDALGNPLWAAYRLRDLDWREPAARPEQFRVDPRTAARIEPGDYTRSGYDRGHLAPNYAIATRYGREAQEDAFLMSNITPQKHPLNAGPWKALEQRIATNYPARFEEIWVVAGPIFGAVPARLKRRVAVPEAFFMIILDEQEGGVRATAFVLPQSAKDESLGSYLVAIDEVERRTGLDFLNELPAAAQAVLESKRPARVW